MKIKFITTAAVVLVGALLTTSAIAQTTTGTGTGTGIAGAASVLNSNRTDNVQGSVGLGALPGGKCINAFNIGAPGVAGVGFSNYRKTCERFFMAVDLYNLKAITIAELRAIGLKQMGITLTQPTPTAAPARSTKPVARPPLPNYKGPWEKLSYTQQVNVKKCRASVDGLRTAACAAGS